MEDKTLSESATKGDLANLKTELKSEISTLGAKVGQLDAKVGQLDGKVTDLAGAVVRIAVDLSKTQADVRKIEETIATKLATKDDISRVIGAIDAFAAEALSYRNRDTLRGDRIMGHEEKLQNHERRLVLLENSK
jgi:outer membrane murein-binding lipoprotein Lpp